MAMYYYARKLQKSARKSKSQNQAPMMGNGSIPSVSVGCVSGSGSGVACTSAVLPSTLTHLGASKSAGGNLNSSNSSTTTDSSNPKPGPKSQREQPQQHQPQPGSSIRSPVNAQPEWESQNQTGLIYEESNLVSGTLEALVQRLVPTADLYPDRAFIFAFILSSRLFLRPHELLATVVQLAFINKPDGESAMRIMRNLIRLLADWAELFPYDFRDDNGLMMANVRNITQKCVTVSPQEKVAVSILLSSLLAKLTALEKFETMVLKCSVDSSPQSRVPSNSPTVLAICPDPNLVAEQLTHIEFERFAFIGAQEYLQAFIKESPVSSSSSSGGSKESKQSRLESYVAWFHRLSLIVATDVCKTGKKKLRARCIEFWVEVARECFNIGNFNSLMAIITGLNMSPVSRLRKTWGKLSCDLLTSLENNMDPSNNFSCYRSLLKSAIWHSSNPAEGRQKVVIPFFSLLIKDLYFLKEECAIRLPNGHLNFEKFRKFGRHVGEIISWQQVACPFPKVPSIIQAIQSLPTLTENGLLVVSFECESPDGSPEAKEYKFIMTTKNELEEASDSLQELPGPSTSSTSSESRPTLMLLQPQTFSLFQASVHSLCQCLPEVSLCPPPPPNELNINGTATISSIDMSSLTIKEEDDMKDSHS